MSKQESGKDILDNAKNKVKKQKETNMKNNKFKTPLTVLLTLVTVAAFAFTFYAGAQFGASNEKSKNAEVHEQVKSLTAVTKK